VSGFFVGGVFAPKTGCQAGVAREEGRGKAGTILKNKRDYLRTDNPTGRNVHPEIRFDLPSEEARIWRQSLISVRRRRSGSSKEGSRVRSSSMSLIEI
jgi:hypothetical protein